jgi:hypothetical protein
MNTTGLIAEIRSADTQQRRAASHGDKDSWSYWLGFEQGMLQAAELLGMEIPDETIAEFENRLRSAGLATGRNARTERR